jgi:hypothetical protein
MEIIAFEIIQNIFYFLLLSKIISINHKSCIAKIKLGRRARNHLNLIYYRAMAVGADLAARIYSSYISKLISVKSHLRLAPSMKVIAKNSNEK